ncbi:hypothetical protein JCM5350_006114 [Sporobolomyces pararoseus]
MDSMSRPTGEEETAWLEVLHRLLDFPPDLNLLYWRADHSFAIRATVEVPFEELRQLGIVRMSTLIRKLEEYGFQRVNEEKLFQDERENFHCFIDYSGAFVPFDSRAVQFMKPDKTRRQLSSEDPSPTGSIIDHGEAAESTPSKQQTTPINSRFQGQVGLDSSTSRSEIRRRLEEHQQALLPTPPFRAQVQTLQTVPLLDPRLPLPPIPSFAATSRYRDELYASTSSSPSTRTPALSRSTSSDCSLSPFPQFSSESSPWTPWIHEFDSSSFPTLSIVEEQPLFATPEFKPPPSQPWPSLPNLEPPFPLFPSLPVPPPKFASFGPPLPSISQSTNTSRFSYQTEPSSLRGSLYDSVRSSNQSRHPLNPSAGVPPFHDSASSLSNHFPPLDSHSTRIFNNQPIHGSFQVLESTEVPTYFPNQGVTTPLPLDPTTYPYHHGNEADSKSRGGTDSQLSRSSNTPQKLLRPSPVRSSPLRPHPYDSNSRTIHSKRDSLNHLSIRRLELLASSTSSASPSSSVSRPPNDQPNSNSKSQCSTRPQISTVTSHPTTRRSSNASLDRILNPSNSSETFRSSTLLPPLPNPPLSVSPTTSLFPHFHSETRSTTTAPDYTSPIPPASSTTAPRSFGTLSDLLDSMRPVLLPNKGAE